MSVTKKVNALNAPEKSFDEKLYMVLSSMDFTRNGYRASELGEGMSVIEQVIWGWWKQRYLIDNKNCRAYEIMDGNMDFVNFTKSILIGVVSSNFLKKQRCKLKKCPHNSQLLLGGFARA